MNNPPFALGQKVVCISSKGSYVKGETYTVGDMVQCERCGSWQVGCIMLGDDGNKVTCPHCHISGKSKGFRYVFAFRLAPIITNYSDATAEILEKFKSPNETPDKILTPEKVTN